VGTAVLDLTGDGFRKLGRAVCTYMGNYFMAIYCRKAA